MEHSGKTAAYAEIRKTLSLIQADIAQLSNNAEHFRNGLIHKGLEACDAPFDEAMEYVASTQRHIQKLDAAFNITTIPEPASPATIKAAEAQRNNSLSYHLRYAKEFAQSAEGNMNGILDQLAAIHPEADPEPDMEDENAPDYEYIPASEQYQDIDINTQAQRMGGDVSAIYANVKWLEKNLSILYDIPAQGKAQRDRSN